MLLLVGGESVGLSMGLTCRVLGLHMHHIYPKMPA
jgi:hypothetical protein